MSVKKITGAELWTMLYDAYNRLPMDPDSKPFGEMVDKLYEGGGFEKLVGATLPTRKRK